MTTQRWDIDAAHSAVHFTVRHMVISKVRGAFERWSGSIQYDPAQPAASKVSVSIEAGSIDTHEPKRDEHLRSADFLDVAKFPTITFESKGVTVLGKDRLKVTGDLTLHGVTREVELDTESLGTGKDPWGNQRIAFQARASLNRKDFGLAWNQALEAGGVLVGEHLEIALDVQAIQSKAAGQAA